MTDQQDPGVIFENPDLLLADICRDEGLPVPVDVLARLETEGHDVSRFR